VSDGVEITVVENNTSVDISENITEVNITPTETTIEVRGISIATSNATGIGVDHDGDSWLNGIATTVQQSLDQLAENPWRFRAGGENEFVGPRDRFYFNTTNGVTASVLTGNDTGINIELTPIFEVPGVSSFSSDTASYQTADIIYNSYGQITGTVTQDISISTSQVANLVATLSSLSAAIVANASQDSTVCAALTARIDSLSSSVSSDLSDLTTRINTVSSAASANEAAALTNSAAIVSANSRIDTVSSVAAANESAIASLSATQSADVASLTTRINTVSAAASANEAAILTNSAAIVSANSRIDTVSAAASANEAAILSVSAELVSTASSLNTRIDTVSSAASANEASLVTANSRINTVSAALATLAISSIVKTASFSAAISANEAAIASLSATQSASTSSLNTRIDTVSTVAAAALSAAGGTISGDLTVTGDLTVSGSTVQLNAEVLNVEDNTIFLNNTDSAITSNCSGVAIFRGTGVDDAEFIFNNTTSSWTLTNYVQLDKVLDSTGGAGSTDQFLSRSSDGTTKWASVVTDTSALDARIDTVSSAASANEAAILTNSAAIVSANSRIDTVSSAASANEAAILTNSAAIVSANSRIDTVSSAASANEAAILTNSAAIVSANSRIDSVSAELVSTASSLNTRIDTNSAAIVAANSRIDTNSSEIAALYTNPVLIDVKNTHTGTVTKGTPVFVSGSVGASGRLEVQPADSSNSSKMPAVGLLAQDLDQNGEGRVVVTGILRAFNTNSIDGAVAGSDNDSGKTIYVKSGGGLTVTRPTSSAVDVQNMGKVGRDHDSSGNLIVSSIMRSNDVPNLADDTFWLGNSGATPTSFSSELQTKLASGSFSAELTALRGDVSGTTINMMSMSSTTMTIGERLNTLQDINIHPGTLGQIFLHYGDRIEASNYETQRLHTTAEGIHVGDNLTGSYTAGDQQNNQDTGFGFVVGQRIDNLGHNNVAFGQNHDFSENTINCFAQGYEVETTNYVKQCMGIGSHIKFTGGTNAVYREGSFGGGQYVEVGGNFSFAWGEGYSLNTRLKATGARSISMGYFTRATGTNSIAMGNYSEATQTGAIAIGYRVASTWHPQAEASRSIAIGGSKALGTDSVAIGTYNTNHGISSSVTLGQSNIVQTTASTGIAIGHGNTVYGDKSAAIGSSCFVGEEVGSVALGSLTKAPQRALDTDDDGTPDEFPSFGDGQVVVGMCNDNHKEHVSADYANDFVAPLHFSVGTGTAENDRYTSMSIGPKSPSASSLGSSVTGQAGFCGIIMEALKDSPSYTDSEASSASSHVPIGGLYRTGNIVKIRVD
jgi:hypothetical protein